MKKNAVDWKLAFFCAAAFAVAYFFLPARIFLSVNDLPNQYHYNASGRTVAAPARIVAVAIDDYSHSRMTQRWPWKRSVYADLFRNLDREGARTIALDVFLRGSSGDPLDAGYLSRALQEIKASVVLGYEFDFQNMAPGAIVEEIPKDAYIPAMLNTLQDADGFIRKARVSCIGKDQIYYSLSVKAVSAFLGKDPAAVAASIRSIADRRFKQYLNFEDRYFYIDYKFTPYQRDRAIPIVSFYDVLNDMEKLKTEWGEHFLKDSLVVVYPAAAILQDIHLTPLGRMPGGFVHINGILNVLSGDTVDSPGFVPFILLGLSLIALIYALRCDTIQSGLAIFAAVIVFNILGGLVLWRFHVKTDFFRVISFSTIFFVSAGLYRIIDFLARLASIKDRATLDPLRGIYTLRYFRYRLDLESRRRRTQAIMVYFRGLGAETEKVPVDRQKQIWSRVNAAVSKVGSCWASYSLEEICGFSFQDRTRLEKILFSLRDDLGEVFQEGSLSVEAKICAAEYSRDHTASDQLAALAGQIRSQTAGVLMTNAIKPLIRGPAEGRAGDGQVHLLDNLADDIEEKNRQLLNLYEKLKSEHDKTREAFYQIIESLVNALEARDPYTQGHSRRVADYALQMADRLGWTPDRKERLRKAALLHDLGKIGIPDAILHKRGQLSEEEFGIIKQHEIFGVNILKPLKEIEDILPWILYHHEKWDGTGYPHGLGGDAIPLASQIIALADVYDALTTGRDYKKSLSKPEAVDIIVKGKGTHFSPQLAEVFISVLG